LAIRSPAHIVQRIRAATSDSPNAQEQALHFAREHPGQVWFPWDTLSTLLADGKLYHFDYGLLDRRLAGLPPSPDHLKRHIPTHLRIIAIPENAPSNESRPRDVAPVQLPQLPGFDVYLSNDRALQP
jgi:hypothetical protein